MPITLRSVARSKNTIRFGERVNDKALRDFVPALYETINRGHRDITLDFRTCERAYADAVLPIVCLLDHRRERGDVFRVLLPELPQLSQLFLNSNWAHFMDPAHPRLDMEHPNHLATRRYVTHQEQQDAVESVLNVVLSNMELRRNIVQALEWSINEITDNVLNHSRASAGGLVQVSTFREERMIKFVVSDGGRGIPSAMREAFPKVGDDTRALGEAVKAGVTSIPQAGQGNGLAGAMALSKAAHGVFKIASGAAQLSVYREDGNERWKEHRTRPRSGFRFPGTTVMVELRTDSEFDIDEALSLLGPAVPISDVVDLRYATDEGTLLLQVASEATGVGSRQAGAELRTKALNLLRADPGRRLVLDWGGLELVSSSFADEAIGKLFVTLGPTVYTCRVDHIGVTATVRGLLDKAVMQRVAQSMAGGEGSATKGV